MPMGMLGGIAAGVIGDVMSSQSQAATNAMSMAIAQKEMDWQTQMSNTQMQRRVADLKAAGLNPMLAVGGPGAAMGSPVMPMLQNPGASFSQLGNQVTNAVQLQTQNAQIEQMKAAANKMNVESGTEIPAQVENIKSQTGLNDARATEVAKNIQILSYGLSSGITQLGMQEDVAQKAIRTHLMQMDQQTAGDTLLSTIRARNDLNYATQIGAKNIYNASETEFGRIMSYFHLAQPLTSAVGTAAGAVGRFVP